MSTRQMKYNLSRLENYMDLWSEPGEFSKPFIANGLLRFAEYVRRHQLDNTLEADRKAKLHNLYSEALKMLKEEHEIITSFLTNITVKYLLNKLDDIKEQYFQGYLIDEEINQEGFDVTDMYFAFFAAFHTVETSGVVQNLDEDMQQLNRELRHDLQVAGESMKDLLKYAPEIAADTRNYAEHAPGGDTVPPWPELLDNAADPLFDAVIEAEIIRKINAVEAWLKENRPTDDMEGSTEDESVVVEDWTRHISEMCQDLDMDEEEVQLLIEKNIDADTIWYQDWIASFGRFVETRGDWGDAVFQTGGVK